jgi:diguanylate cyclase (GGDEF)-like protein
MNETEREPSQSDIHTDTQTLQSVVERVERRDWWLWLVAIVIMLLQTLAVIALALPVLVSSSDRAFQSDLNVAVRALAGLVLLFTVYTVYQQVLFRRLRRQILDQLQMRGQLEVRAEEFHKLATLDPLTGLSNRRLAEQRLAGEVSRSQRYGHPLAVLMLDLNGFKQINDRYGHAAGDAALQAFAQRVRSVIRASDLAVRMGGDEFLVVLPECLEQELQELLRRLRSTEVRVAGQAEPITFAAGSAGYRSGDTPEQMLERADQALYAEKRARATAGSSHPGEVHARR